MVFEVYSNHPRWFSLTFWQKVFLKKFKEKRKKLIIREIMSACEASQNNGSCGKVSAKIIKKTEL